MTFHCDQGLTAEQADAVARWQKTLTGIAIEEMLHLALVMNVMTAIGAGPTQLEDKVMGLASRVIPQEQAAKIADTARKLEEVKGSV